MSVTALVYVDTFAPDSREGVIQFASAQPGSAFSVADPTTAVSLAPHPGDAPGDYVLATLFSAAFVDSLSAALDATQRLFGAVGPDSFLRSRGLEEHPVLVPRWARGSSAPGRGTTGQHQARPLPLRRRRSRAPVDDRPPKQVEDLIVDAARATDRPTDRTHITAKEPPA